MSKASRYRYFKSDHNHKRSEEKCQHAHDLGEERFNPSLKSPDYLILMERRRNFAQWLKNIPDKGLKILDVGGRIQPYRSLFGDKIEQYFAVDPQLEGLLDIVAYGEHLPLKSDYFDVVLCTQVLSYAKDPASMIREIYRVLNDQGVLLLSAPALFPRHHDERWRFLPDGLRSLLYQFERVEIAPEGGSISGVLRTLNVCFSSLVSNVRLQRFFSNTLIPLNNLTGKALCKFKGREQRLVANYSVLAQKSCTHAFNTGPAEHAAESA